MSPLAELFLFAHVLGAIAVFGPTFAFPMIARAAQGAPMHGHFAAELSERIETRIVIPGAVVQGLTGLALIVTIGLDVSSPSWRWLTIAIALYLIAIVYAIVVQAPAARRMVALSASRPGTASGPAPADPVAPTAALASADVVASPPPPAGPAGPPPELVATARRLQRGGLFMTALVIAIVFLMVVKPTLG
jgi:uncharacterized membrane protein